MKELPRASWRVLVGRSTERSFEEAPVVDQPCCRPRSPCYAPSHLQFVGRLRRDVGFEGVCSRAEDGDVNQPLREFHTLPRRELVAVDEPPKAPYPFVG